MKLIILNYRTGQVDVFNITKEEKQNLDAEQFMEDHEYNWDEVEYMVAENLIINNLN